MDEFQQAKNDFAIQLRRFPKRSTSTPIYLRASQQDPSRSATIDLGCITSHYENNPRDIFNTSASPFDHITSVLHQAFPHFLHQPYASSPYNGTLKVMMNNKPYTIWYSSEKKHDLCYDISLPAPEKSHHEKIMDYVVRGKVPKRW